MTNRITLKNIKYAAFASEETHCYSASVYFDGKRVGTVKNDGHGGADYQYPEDKDGWDEMGKYIATLPEITTTFGGEAGFTLIQDLELICGDLVNDFLVTKDLKRALSKKVLFKKKGSDGVFETKGARNKATLEHWVTQIAEREDTTEVLNLLPIDKALEIYRAI
jgi:hypothetical protein